jgi:hypothetical protein
LRFSLETHPHSGQVRLVFVGGTAISQPPFQWSLYSSCRLNSAHPWSRMDRFSPDLRRYGRVGSSALLVNQARHFPGRVSCGKRKAALAISRQRAMEQTTLVPDAGEVVLECVKAARHGPLLMTLRAFREQSICPRCHRPSTRVHSHYWRQLSDLPWEGMPVRILLHVRRFFCDTDGCEQRIFTERLPNTVIRYARRTCRLSAAIEQIAWALGGSAGSRLARQLGVLACASTFLRQLRRKTLVVPTQGPRVLGIDDWAWRKRQRYGTILCDLEGGKVIDLLPDRSEKSTEQWLRNHPGTEIVSRDRASLYASAATKAVPQAIQVADRWHLLHNLSEALVSALVPYHRLLTEVARSINVLRPIMSG